MKDKNQTRKEIISIRESLDIVSKIQWDDMICEKLFKEEVFKNAKKIFIYLSYNNEINTDKIIKEAFRTGKIVGVPRTVFKDRKMDFINIKNYDDISKIPKNKMGIKEPSDGEVLYPDLDTVVITPGVAFTIRGERLGYGGGFYDTYLENYHIKNKIALCYEFQILTSIPVYKNDMLVSKIITENRVIEIS